MSVKSRLGVLIEGTIGDSLILVPTLRMLQQKFPDCSIEVISFTNADSISAEAVLSATFPRFAFTVINNSGEQNIFRRLGAWIMLTKRIRSQGINLLVYAVRPEEERASHRARWHRGIVKLLTSVEEFGFHVDKWPLANATKNENLISKLLFDRIARSFKLKKQFSDFDHRIKIGSDDLDTGTAWLGKQFGARPQQYYALCVSGKTAAQRWPLQRYLEVVVALHTLYSLEPVFIGSPNEADEHAQMISELGFGFTSAGLSIGQSSMVIGRAKFYLGNDTGPMHLAAALDRQCVVVQSSRNIAGTWDPLGEEHVLHKSEPDCAGCGAVECRLQEQLCLTNITVDQVLSSCKNLLSSKHHLAEPNL
jgi:ADP-heptose:LPS heptosyltransferase